MDIKPSVFMERCLQLARLGMRRVAPNPMVGAVIVKDDQIVAEAFHSEFGKAHAEAEAINQLNHDFDYSGCTLYVNLEPCSHFGKTPPCSDLILKKGIPHVVTGMQDPFARVNGAGIRKLRKAGVRVETGLLEAECRQLNRRFIRFHTHQRPYIILKWAESADGFIGQKGQQVPISGNAAMQLVHQWRSEEQGIVAGAQTILNDNPRLNVRHVAGESPVRIILDRSGALNGRSQLNVLDGSQSTIIFTSLPDYLVPNAEIIPVSASDFLKESMHYLYMKGISSILVEGGRGILDAFMNENLWDECRVFRSPKFIGSGIKAPALAHAPASSSVCGEDIWHEIHNPGA